ncbi:MAG TPA: flagellar basal body rod protein FlgB [Alphaproteobacteria bacterium]|nr:flagellar basal body rod protein FlgB [Alphaproteobacteria bacterium]
MSIQNIGLFKAIGAKIDYLDARQKVIAQNIANADTPGYRPSDLTPIDFGQVLKTLDGEKMAVRIDVTNPLHMPEPGVVASTQADEQKKTYEVAPAENSVILEEQMLKATQNQVDFNLAINLYQKNLNMIRTALGRNG